MKALLWYQIHFGYLICFLKEVFLRFFIWKNTLIELLFSAFVRSRTSSSILAFVPGFPFVHAKRWTFPVPHFSLANLPSPVGWGLSNESGGVVWMWRMSYGHCSTVHITANEAGAWLQQDRLRITLSALCLPLLTQEFILDTCGFIPQLSLIQIKNRNNLNCT